MACAGENNRQKGRGKFITPKKRRGKHETKRGEAIPPIAK